MLSLFSCNKNKTFFTDSNFEAAVDGFKVVRPIPQEPQATRVEHRLRRLQLVFFRVDSSPIFIYINPRRATKGFEILELGVCMLGATLASGNRLRLRLLLALLATAR